MTKMQTKYRQDMTSAAPAVGVDLAFLGNMDKKFAITKLGPHSSVEGSDNPELADAYHQFRHLVYVEQLGILGDESRSPRGREIDGDDSRSNHFIVLENRVGQAAVIACMRLISSQEGLTLPIEGEFEAIRRSGVVEPGGVEVSRFITRHNNARERDVARTTMLAVALAHVNAMGQGPAYAIIERDLERHLRRINIPVDRLGNYTLLSSYRSENAPVRINTAEMTNRFGGEAVRSMYTDPGQWRYWGNSLVSRNGEAS